MLYKPTSVQQKIQLHNMFKTTLFNQLCVQTHTKLQHYHNLLFTYWEVSAMQGQKR